MDKHYTYKTNGQVCCGEISFDLVDGILHNVVFHGGCRGNTQGVAALAGGMAAEDVVTRLRGIACHGADSCPDQLAQAVTACLAEG